MAAGPGGVSGGGHVPFSAEWLRQAGRMAKQQATGKTADTSETGETANLSEAAQKLAITKDEKMLQAMKAVKLCRLAYLTDRPRDWYICLMVKGFLRTQGNPC